MRRDLLHSRPSRGGATIELDNNDGNATDDEYLRHAIVDWVRSLGIDDELEPEEWKALQLPIGMLESQDLINAMWRVEGSCGPGVGYEPA